ncbi:oligosaccharide flippase family protein [Herbiconiux sp. 11R-BC]|uniref:oligosaccharide flippase family protein n=1 Tax=Herbiconiux sp. 11R-BC TaxID=3111637 RepID=UPI003C0B7077
MSTNLAAAGARGGLVTIFSQVLSLITRMVGLIFLARLLPPEVFGLAAIVVAITTFASAVIFLGLPMATVQATTLSQRAKSSLFVINTGLGVGLGLILFFSAGLIASYYGDDRLVPMVQWLALVPTLSGIQSQFRLQLVRNLEFTGLAASEVVSQLLGTCSAIVLALMGKTYEAIIAQSVVQSLSQLLIVTILSRWLPTIPGAWATEVKELLIIGLRIFGTNLLRDGSRSIVVPIMAVFNSPAAIGNYDRAQQLAIVPINLTVDQLQRVAIPILSQFRDAPARMLAYMRRAQLAAAYGTATGFLVGAALAQPLLTFLLGPDWTLAGTILQALAIGAVFRTLGQSMQWIFISAGATKQGFTFSLWSQPAIVLISLAGLPWGVLGVAIANAIAWSLYWPAATIVASRAAGFASAPLITDALRAFSCFGIPVGLAALIARFLGLDDLPTILVGIGFAVVMAALLAILIRPIRNDLLALLDVLKLALQKR